MDTKTKQILSSFLAILLCAAFLWVGKTYIWDKALPGIPKPDDTLDSQIVPDVTGTEGTDGSNALTTDLTAGTDSTALSTADQGQQSSGSQSSTAENTQTTPLTSSESAQSSSTGASSTESAATSSQTTATESPLKPAQGFGTAPEGYFRDALFIGDSRMVGIASYAPFEGANYFATVGLATYKVDKVKSEVDNKSIAFSSLLSSKTYGKIYIMLGINEIGNDRTATMKKYADLVNTIRAAQPNAVIYLCANLHVTAKRSAKGDAINNQSINSFNAAVKNLCDNSTVYYLDVNPSFDDESGCLRADYTNDGVHPLAKYYKLWAEWFKQNVILR